MKTLFIGGTRRGLLALEALLKSGAAIGGILSLTQDAHEADRCEGPIRQLAEERRIPLRESRLASDPALAAWARETGAQAAFVVGARVLLPEALFGAMARGCWAAHDSLLPAYRGFAPLNWAVINGETSTGVSLFRVTAEVDAGDILLQHRVAIGPTETAPQVYEKVCAATNAVVVEGHAQLRDQRARPQPQDHRLATFTCSRTPADGLIDWAQPTRAIFNLVRGLTLPYPGAFTYYRGEKLTVVSADAPAPADPYVGRIPGRVVRLRPDQGVEVLTGDGLLVLREVSRDGRTRQPAAEVIRSVRARLGLDLAALLDAAAARGQPSA